VKRYHWLYGFRQHCFYHPLFSQCRLFPISHEPLDKRFILFYLTGGYEKAGTARKAPKKGKK